MSNSQNDYADRQSVRDDEYRDAWRRLSPERASRLGGPSVPEYEAGRGRERVGLERDVAEMCDVSADAAVMPDMAGEIDTPEDVVMERFGVSLEQARLIVRWCDAQVERAQMQLHATIIARVIGMFLTSNDNLKARAHALAHAARLASMNGLRSLRHSAELCGVSAEWMSKLAQKWCEELGLPPVPGAKSAAAREKYSADKDNNHWRKQKCKRLIN